MASSFPAWSDIAHHTRLSSAVSIGALRSAKSMSICSAMWFTVYLPEPIDQLPERNQCMILRHTFADPEATGDDLVTMVRRKMFFHLLADMEEVFAFWFNGHCVAPHPDIFACRGTE